MREARLGSAVFVGKKAVLVRLGEDETVLETIPVIITELTKGLWGNPDFRNWTALSEAGEEFTGSWWQNQGESDFPFRMWDKRNDQRGKWQPFEESA